MRGNRPFVQLLSCVVGAKMGVKAADGIRNLADLQAITTAGVSRLSASADAATMQETLA